MTSSDDAHAGTRRMMETAIRRLNVIEYVILGAAMCLALTAGALTAWLLQGVTGAPFRILWIVTSLLFFGVPGLMVLRRERRAATRDDTEGQAHGSTTTRDDG